MNAVAVAAVGAHTHVKVEFDHIAVVPLAFNGIVAVCSVYRRFTVNRNGGIFTERRNAHGKLKAFAGCAVKRHFHLATGRIFGIDIDK